MSKKQDIKEYTNGEVTIVWKSNLCIHSANCVNGLPGVFDVKARPWINAEGASTQEIVEQIKKCPSGALTYYMNGEEEEKPVMVEEERLIEVVKNGPLMVFGNIKLRHADGSTSQQHRVTAFCRCGASNNKPFCDGTHKKVGFTEGE